MTLSSDHRVQLILSQLLWIQKRRERITESVAAHFGRAKIDKLISSLALRAPYLEPGTDYLLLLDDKTPQEFIRQLALDVEFDEALVVQSLRSSASAYPEHVDEQILFGSRNAGQDAGRALLRKEIRRKFSLVELYQAIESLCYQGMPDDNNFFVSLRPLGHISVHFERCAHVDAWRMAKADPVFQEQIQSVWIRGIIDILSPQTIFQRQYSIPKGDAFGLDHYLPRNKQLML